MIQHINGEQKLLISHAHPSLELHGHPMTQEVRYVDAVTTSSSLSPHLPSTSSLNRHIVTS
jgi:hypothetical protein